ncbi:MAG: hypothetical protein C5B43_03880 [Verrucomicrobia bacterium]|nr:MAG: hypothetical protein C5B43_03880 [Verrucomicrobiota bacterium]
MNFEFYNPHFLWLLLLIPLIAFLKGRPGKKAASLLFSNTLIAHKVSKLKRSQHKRFLFALELLTLVSLIIALARPQFYKTSSFVEASGIDIVLALDISESMLALDLATRSNLVTRLDVAKSVLEDFIKDRPNDRIGLVAFSANSYLVSPLTLNHDWLETNLKRLKVGIGTSGTAIGDAIAMSVNRLKDLPSKSRVVILLTDGANNAGQISPLTAAEIAAAFNTKIYSISVGRGGIVPTLLLDDAKNIRLDRFGRPVVIQAEFEVDEETLAKISELTGAKSYKATNLSELSEIYKEINRLETTKVKLNNQTLYKEAFMYPLYLALFLIFIEKILTNTRFRRIP